MGFVRLGSHQARDGPVEFGVAYDDATLVILGIETRGASAGLLRYRIDRPGKTTAEGARSPVADERLVDTTLEAQLVVEEVDNRDKVTRFRLPAEFATRIVREWSD